MRDPYEVLGIPRGSDPERVKAAYRALAKKYHPDNYIDSPLADVANEKMQEINEAYDAIISGNTSSYSSGSNYTYNDYSRVEHALNSNLFDEAEIILESMPESARDAAWYYYKGQANYQRGWTDQAYSYFTMAHKMDPSNAQYTHAYENLRNQRSGGFRTGRAGSRGNEVGSSCCSCDGCDICTGLLCADCCCECMGGDCIPGC